LRHIEESVDQIALRDGTRRIRIQVGGAWLVLGVIVQILEDRSG
jgi:hypothetical protein